MKIIFILFFFIISLASAQTTAFFKTYGGNNGYSVIQTTDSSFVVTGGISGGVRLVKTNFLGDTIFTRKYPTVFWGEGYSVEQTIDSGYIITGSIGNPDTMMEGSSDIIVIKTNSLGDTLWTKTWGLIPDTISISNEGIGDIGYSVRQTIDSGYIVAGMYNYSINYTGIFPPTAFLYKFSSTGDSVWSKTYDSMSVAKSVIQTYNGDYVFTGCIVISPFSYVYVVRTNQTGDTLWTRKLNFGFQNVDGEEIIQTDDSSFVITGTINNGSNSNLLLCKINNNGQVIWSKIYDNGCYQNDYGFSVDECTDGGLIVTGGAGCSIFNIWLLRTDKDGDTLWTKNYGSSGVDNGNSVKQCLDRGFIITGKTMGGMFLIKTDSLGNAPGLDSNIELPENDSYKINVYPNPANDLVNLNFKFNKPEDITIELYNITGKKVAFLYEDKNIVPDYNYNINIDTKGLCNGVYFIVLKTERNSRTLKLTILR